MNGEVMADGVGEETVPLPAAEYVGVPPEVAIGPTTLALLELGAVPCGAGA